MHVPNYFKRLWLAMFPSQAGQAGKFLTTNGNTVSWGSVGASITNGAGANVIPKSNGTDLVGSQLSDDGFNIDFGGAGAINIAGLTALSIQPASTNGSLGTGNHPWKVARLGPDAFTYVQVQAPAATDARIQNLQDLDGTVQLDTATRLAVLTFATLPAAGAGKLAYISDCNSNVWGANAAGGGANKVLVWYNGTNWTVFGK